jgi:voltage-gated potassium channel
VAYGPLSGRDATLVVMNDNAHSAGRRAGGGFGVNDPRDRLAAYESRTEIPMDLLALVTLWLVVVPPWDFGHNLHGIAWTARIAVSVVYGIDLAIRSVLSTRPARYALTHPVVLASVIYPPVRVVFSVRLVRSMFRRGNLLRFLLAAAVLVLNGAVMAYLFERHASGSNIHTLGESLWWSVVTVTTVGYGDYTPVTVDGRITAGCIMGIGLLTLAVVTAQVASSFVAQGTSGNKRSQQIETVPPEVTLAELDRRLARIEALLIAAAPSSRQTAQAPDPESGTS